MGNSITLRAIGKYCDEMGNTTMGSEERRLMLTKMKRKSFMLLCHLKWQVNIQIGSSNPKHLSI